jgi:hypothetical protein
MSRPPHPPWFSHPNNIRWRIQAMKSHVRWVPSHHGMARSQIADGRAAANILNKQSRTADKGWSSSLGVGRGANNPSP